MSEPKTVEHTPTRTPMQVSFYCYAGENLPIKIPVGSTAHILPLNRVIPARQEMAFFDVPNFDGSSPIFWPDPEKVKLAEQKGNRGGTNAYRCEIHNDGPENVLELVIPVTVYYGSTSPLARKAVNNIVLNPLDRGATFTFFLMNSCPRDENMVIPHFARGRYPEQKSTHRFRLEVAAPLHESSTFGLNPSDVDWTSDACR